MSGWQDGVSKGLKIHTGHTGFYNFFGVSGGIRGDAMPTPVKYSRFLFAPASVTVRHQSPGLTIGVLRLVSVGSTRFEECLPVADPLEF